jgi:hypothetical protein
MVNNSWKLISRIHHCSLGFLFVKSWNKCLVKCASWWSSLKHSTLQVYVLGNEASRNGRKLLFTCTNIRTNTHRTSTSSFTDKMNNWKPHIFRTKNHAEHRFTTLWEIRLQISHSNVSRIYTINSDWYLGKSSYQKSTKKLMFPCVCSTLQSETWKWHTVSD